jgi:V/A-type H+/Na+-transporting ATPase subunit C
MAACLLQPHELDLLVTGDSDERKAVLERTGVAGLIAELESGRYLEQSAVKVRLAEMLVLLRAAGEARKFLRYWTMRFELTNLKAIVRGKIARAPLSAVRAELTDMGYLATLPIEELLLTEDIDELLRSLETTNYADMVRFARRAFEAQTRLFDLDAALDRRYYQGLVQQARPLEEKLGRSFRDLMGLLIDRVNLVWMLRYRFMYDLPPAQVYYLLVPGSYRLSSSLLRDLSVQSRFEDVLAGLPEPFNGWLQTARTPYEAAAILEEKAAQEARAILHSNAPAFSRVLAYLMLRERDLRRMRAALKGWSMGLDTQTINQALGLAGLEPAPQAMAA